MDVLIVRDTPFVSELHNLLVDAVKQAAKQAQPTLTSYTQRVSPVDAIDLFHRSRTLVRDRFFWSQPGGALALVGVGAAFVIDTVEESRFRQTRTSWQQLLAQAFVEGPRGLPGVGPLLFGGFAFDPAYPQDADSTVWHGYSSGRMVLPEIQFTSTEDGTWLTVNAVVDGSTDIAHKEAELATLYDRLTAPVQDSHATNGHGPYANQSLNTTLHELVSPEAWQDNVAYVASAIRNGELEKVVLARGLRVEAPTAFDLASALRKLVAEYVGCYKFAVAYGDRCFLGATPEQLIRLQDGRIKTMSLAGSTRRGATPDEDRELGDALLSSPKNREEHLVVVRTITETLNEMCDDLQVAPEPSLLKLGNVQHLCTQITGKLAEQYTLLDLVERLHPTPAVGGRPREAALKLIREREGLDRGWYAGSVGWLDQDGEGEFSVALRSALVHGAEATLFAGCGIVGDSDPEREYAESLLKLKPMLSALTGQ